MEYNVEQLSPTQRKISVTVPTQAVNSAMDAAVRGYGRGLSLAGFRKGKVPASVIEKRFPREVVAQATDELVNAQIADILDKEGLRPVGRVQFDGMQVGRNADYAFSFSFEILPEIKLPEDLSALSVDVEPAGLSDTEVDDIMERVRKSLATLEPISEDRTAAYGDVVRVDINATQDGRDVPGMKVSNYSMQLREPKEGAGNLEIDAVILSLKAGEEGQGTMTCPEDYPDPDLRGKEVNFTIKLHSVNRENLPELDEELAKKVGFDSVEALRKMVLDNASAGKQREVRFKGQNKLLSSVLDELDFPLPEAMVNLHLNEYLAEQRNNMMRQGVDAKSIGENLEKLREEGMIEARVQAKSQAFLTALAWREDLKVTEQDLSRQIMQMAQETQQDFNKLVDALHQNNMMAPLQDKILATKALEFMYNKAAKNMVDAKA